jgi:radical SAM-linked protein
MDVERFKEQLASQLPSDIPLYRVEEVDLKAPAATQLLERAEYAIAGARVQDSELGRDLAVKQWQDWVEAIQASEAIWWEQTTKSHKKKQVNLRDRLFELQVDEPQTVRDERGHFTAVVRYIGSCRNDGTLLRPEHLVYMLEQVAQQEFQLLHSHRQQLILAHGV